ncbi:MAG TPA: GNAT family N-acetyltransferase [Leifsonia sp.]|nr:GNAT family N-acetyltransferase [Leifsonia sp.]
MRRTLPAETLHIRAAAPDEYSAVGDLTHAAYTHDYADLHEDYLDQLKHPEKLLDDFDVWVAADLSDDALLGTIAILRQGHEQVARILPHELYFRLLAVHPSARGRGVGIALTEFAVEQAAARGQSAVVLNSGPEMLGAHALYRKLSFTRRSEREGTIVLPDGRELELLTFVRDLDV